MSASPLAARIFSEIDAAGPMRLDRYMTLCLTDPKHGYYAAGAPIGAAGDFTTAPEISQIFGEIIGLWLAQCWLDLGSPSPFALVELGPGRGVLMADALRAARAAPGFLDAARLTFVEASAPLREQQAQRVASAPLGAPPRWAARLEEVEPAPLLLVANEFFDALPIRQWRLSGDAWRERLIAARDGRLVFCDGAPEAAPEAAGAAAASAPEGGVFEDCAEGRAVAAEIGRRLAASGGAALMIDYGYQDADRAAAGWRDTFQAARGHRYADPLAEPGAADLTAHVAFDALRRAAEVGGAGGAVPLAAHAPLSQGALLIRLGAEMRAAALARAAPERGPEIAAALHRLTGPDAMGALFRALALSAGLKGAPAAFSR